MLVTASRAEGDGVVGRLARVARPERSSRGLVVRVRVRVRAAFLCKNPTAALDKYPQGVEWRQGRTEVGVVLDAARRAGLRGVVRARAAVRAVGGVAEAGDARGLAADDLAGRVLRARERRRAVRVEVDGAVRDVAALVVLDAHGDVEPVDERDCGRVRAVSGCARSRQSGLCKYAPSYQSWLPSPWKVNSATVAGGTPVPVCGSHKRPPLHPPSRQELGPGLVEKSQLRRPQIRPAFQLSGTVKEMVWPDFCSQPVGWLGVAVPTFRSVKSCGLVGK